MRLLQLQTVVVIDVGGDVFWADEVELDDGGDRIAVEEGGVDQIEGYGGDALYEKHPAAEPEDALALEGQDFDSGSSVSQFGHCHHMGSGGGVESLGALFWVGLEGDGDVA